MKRLPITNAQRRQIQRQAILKAQNQFVQALRNVLRIRGDKPAMIDAVVTATLRQVTTRSITRKKLPGRRNLSDAERTAHSEAMKKAWAKRRARQTSTPKRPDREGNAL